MSDDIKRVAHRLASIDSDERFHQVLDKLLPRLLHRLADEDSNHEVVRVLTHVMKRVKDASECRLPCGAIIDIVRGNDNTWIRNLGLAFLKVGLPREPAGFMTQLLPSLVELLGSLKSKDREDYPSSEALDTQVCWMLEMVCCVLSRPPAPVDMPEACIPVLFDVFLDILLYTRQPPESRLPCPGLSQGSTAQIMLVELPSIHAWIPHLFPSPEQVLLAMVLKVVQREDMLWKHQWRRLQRTDERPIGLEKVSTTVLLLCLGHARVLHMFPDIQTLGALPMTIRQYRRCVARDVQTALVDLLASAVLPILQETQVPLAMLSLEFTDITLRRLPCSGLSMVQAKPYMTALLLLLVTTKGRGTNDEIVQRILKLVCGILENAIRLSDVPEVFSPGSIAVRDVIYQIICATVPSEYLCEAPDLLRILFTCVAVEPDSVRPLVMSALEGLMSACRRRVLSRASPGAGELVLAVEFHELFRSLPQVIWSAAQPHCISASRMAAVKWARNVWAEVDKAGAAHILCFLSGDPDACIAKDAVDTLGDCAPLCFSDFWSLLVPSDSTRDSMGVVRCYADFSTRGKERAISHATECFVATCNHTSKSVALCFAVFLVEELTSLHRHCISTKEGLDLFDQLCASLCALVHSSDHVSCSFSTTGTGLCLRDLEVMVLDTITVRSARLLGSSCGCVYRALLENGRFVWSNVVSVLAHCCSKLLPVASNTAGRELGNAGPIYMGVHLLSALRSGNYSHLETSRLCAVQLLADVVLEVCCTGCDSRDDLLFRVCADGIAIVFSTEVGHSAFGGYHFLPSCAKAMRRLALSVHRSAREDDMGHMDSIRVLALGKACKPCLEAAAAYVRLASEGPPLGTRDSQLQLTLLESSYDCMRVMVATMFSAVCHEDPCFALLIGECMAQCRSLVPASRMSVDSKHTQSPSGSDDVDWCMLLLNEARHGIKNRTPCILGALAILRRLSYATRTSENNTGAIETSLPVSNGAIDVPCLVDNFVHLLGDPPTKRLGRDACYLALAMCHGLSRCQLHDGLEWDHCVSKGRTLLGSPEADEFEPHSREALPIAQRQSMHFQPHDSWLETTNSEVDFIANAAGASKQIEIKLTLLALSLSNDLWDTSAAAMYKDRAFECLGFDSRSEAISAIRDAFVESPGGTLSRFLRALYDPSERTREAATRLQETIWECASGMRTLVSRHLGSVLDTLLLDSQSSSWRVRAAAYGALAEVIVDRDWTQLQGGRPSACPIESRTSAVRTLRCLWESVARALDDIRDAVRSTGIQLARNLGSLTFSLCCTPNTVGIEFSEDSLQTSFEAGSNRVVQETSACAIETCVPWLLGHLNHSNVLLSVICLRTLMRIMSKSDPAHGIWLFIPDVLRALLLILPASHPYATGNSNQEMSSYSEQSILASKMLSRCLDIVSTAPIDCQRRVVVVLDDILCRNSRRVTCEVVSAFVSNMCVRCPEAMKAASCRSPSVRLLVSLHRVGVSRHAFFDREKLLAAMGCLGAFCPSPTVEKLACEASQCYRISFGSADDPLVRQVCATVLHAFTSRSLVHHMQQNDPGDEWLSIVLPTVYVGQFDPEQATGHVMEQTWDAARQGIAERLSDRVGHTLDEKVLVEITSECCHGLEGNAWSRRVACAKALLNLCDRGILVPLTTTNEHVPRSSRNSHCDRNKQRSFCAERSVKVCLELLSAGRAWTGKTTVLETAIRLVSCWSSPTDLRSIEWMTPWLQSTPYQTTWTPNTERLPATPPLQTGDGKVPLAGFCKWLAREAFQVRITAASDEWLPYRLQALRGLSSLLQPPNSAVGTGHAHQNHPRGQTQINVNVSSQVRTYLESFLHDSKNEPAVIVVETILAISACFHTDCEGGSLVALLFQTMGSHRTWSIAHAIGRCASSLAKFQRSSELSAHDTISNYVTMASIFSDHKKDVVR